MSWREIATKYLRAVPKGATPRERGAALKRASAEYRGRRPNPSTGGLMKLAIIGGVAYVGAKMLQKKTTTQPAPPPAEGSGI